MTPRVTTPTCHLLVRHGTHLHEAWLPYQLLHQLLHAWVLHRLHHAIQVVGRAISAADAPKAAKTRQTGAQHAQACAHRVRVRWDAWHFWMSNVICTWNILAA